MDLFCSITDIELFKRIVSLLLKGLIIGGGLFLLLKKLPEIFNSDLYKQMIITIEKHIVPGIKKLFNLFKNSLNSYIFLSFKYINAKKRLCL